MQVLRSHNHARRVTVLMMTLLVFGLTAQAAFAGRAHFVGTPTITRDGDAITVSGKVAGLGDETQINVAVTADVACVDPGNNLPKAENKGATIAEGTFPVQIGKANFSGKLPISWPTALDQLPVFNKAAGGTTQMDYFLGYRYFDNDTTKKLLYPFGYGLSYTKYEYSNLGPAILGYVVARANGCAT